MTGIAELTYLTSAEAAQVMRVAPSTLRRWRCEGFGPKWLKAGARVLYRQSDIQNFVEKNN